MQPTYVLTKASVWYEIRVHRAKIYHVESHSKTLAFIFQTDINITKKRNWYIMSPMKNQKHQFYNFCMKFSISKHHRRRNFLAFQLREGRKRSGKFTANPDYTFYRLWIPRLLQSLFLVNSQENQQKFKFSFPLSAARNW